MAVNRATRESKPVTQKAPQPKTIALWCDVCHTKRTEPVFQAWQKCPFTDCRGTLRATPPPEPPPRPKFQKPQGLPLLDSL